MTPQGYREACCIEGQRVGELERLVIRSIAGDYPVHANMVTGGGEGCGQGQPFPGEGRPVDGASPAIGRDRAPNRDRVVREETAQIQVVEPAEPSAIRDPA